MDEKIRRGRSRREELRGGSQRPPMERSTPLTDSLSDGGSLYLPPISRGAAVWAGLPERCPISQSPGPSACLRDRDQSIAGLEVRAEPARGRLRRSLFFLQEGGGALASAMSRMSHPCWRSAEQPCRLEATPAARSAWLGGPLGKPSGYEPNLKRPASTERPGHIWMDG
jgi:hypothetical protein